MATDDAQDSSVASLVQTTYDLTTAVTNQVDLLNDTTEVAYALLAHAH